MNLKVTKGLCEELEGGKRKEKCSIYVMISKMKKKKFEW